MTAQVDYQYVITPMYILQDERLTSSDMITYGIICSYAWGSKDQCWPSQARMTNDFKAIPLRTIQRSIKTLKGLGYITVKRGGDDQPNTYQIVKKVQLDQNEPTEIRLRQNGASEIRIRQNDVSDTPHRRIKHYKKQTSNTPSANAEMVQFFWEALQKNYPTQTLPTPPRHAYINAAEICKRYTEDTFKTFKDICNWYFNPPEKAFWASSARGWNHFYKSFDSIFQYAIDFNSKKGGK